jgi:hypothetical protein
VFSIVNARGAYLFRVGQVLEKRVLAPGDSLLLVRVGVFETCRLTSLSTDQALPRHEHQHAHVRRRHRDSVPMKVRSDFVAFTRADRMALGAARLEELSTALSVTYAGLDV